MSDARLPDNIQIPLPAPGMPAVFADGSTIPPQAPYLPGSDVEGALLAGVLIAVVFFLGLHWTQKKRPVYIGTMVFALVETLRLWVTYARDTGLTDSFIDQLAPPPILAVVLSYACATWIAPRLLELSPRLKTLAYICHVHVAAFAAIALLGIAQVRFPVFDPVIALWTGTLGALLAALGGWQALRAPEHVRMPAFCFCLAYLLTTLVLLLDVGPHTAGTPSVETLWLAAAIARTLLICGAVMLIRTPKTPSFPATLSERNLDTLARLNHESISAEPDLSAEQIELRLADTLTELASAADMQRQINSMMSHELRVPVSTISAAAQSLEMILSGSGEIVESRLARIRRSVSRITELLEQFLGQDRLDHQNFKVMHEAIDLSQLARDIIASMQPDAGHSLMVDAPAPVIAWCDRPLTGVVLRNLVHNAIKYSAANQPVVVRTRSVNVNGQMTPTLSVIDRGPGIDIAEQARVFESQYRRPSHRETKGMGIGLYLARRICEQQGGSLTVDSAPGRGARFDINLPAAEPPK